MNVTRPVPSANQLTALYLNPETFPALPRSTLNSSDKLPKTFSSDWLPQDFKSQFSR